MSVREFAAHLGVSERVVSKWEAGHERMRPRPLNQSALDTSLATADMETKSRYTQIVDSRGGCKPLRQVTSHERVSPLTSEAVHLVRHPLDGAVMTLIDAGPFRVAKCKLVWLPAFYIDVNPITNAQYARFLAATGHRPPSHWPNGSYALADEPDAFHDEPATALGWTDACVYARWASKALPIASQWDRASKGQGAIDLYDIQEWCLVRDRPSQRGPSTAPQGGFRCVTGAADLLALLAI